MSDSLGFDVAAHPDARSKVAVDMLARLSADTQALAAATSNPGPNPNPLLLTLTPYPNHPGLRRGA